jgi:branched-chain amino acid transport system permease protein
MSVWEDRLAERAGGFGRQVRARTSTMAARWQALPTRTKVAFAVAGIVVLYLLPYAPDYGFGFLEPKNSDYVSVLFYPIAIYVLVAVGLNIVVGETGLLDLGYVAFFAVGAYTTGILGSLHGDLPWPLLLPIGVLLALTAGVILGAPTLRLRGDYLAIVTLGFGEMIRITANNLHWLGDARGISNIPKPPSVGPLKFRLLDAKPYYWLALTLIILVVLAAHTLERSRIGRYWTAIREDEDAAELMGVPTFRFKLLAFATGAAMGGLSGVLYASRVGFINPDTFPLDLSILFLAAIVLGGAGNLPGVILGAIVVAYVPERFRFLEERRVLFFGLALVLTMIFRPQGLLPRKIRGSRTYAGDGTPPVTGPAGEARS